MRLADLLDRVHALTRPYEDRPACLAASTAEAMNSTVTNAVATGVSERLAISHRDALDRISDGLDVLPYIPHLEAYAEAWARARGHVRPGNARTLVRRWRRLALPKEYAHGRSRGGFDLLPPAWAPVLTAVDEMAGLSVKSRRQGRTDVARIARAAFRYGVDGPAQLPPRPVLERWLLDAGCSSASVKNAIGAYRRATRHLAAAAPHLVLVHYAENPHPAARNLRHMPEVDRMVGLRPDGRRARELTTIEILDYVAPQFAAAFREWETVRAARPDTRQKLLSAIDRTVAALIRAGDTAALNEPPTVLFESIVPDPSADDGPAVGGAAAAALGLGRQARRRIPLIWKLIDEIAPQVRERSPLKAERDFYPPVLHKDVVALYYWVDNVFRPTFTEYAPERWTVIEAQFHRFEAHIKHVNRGAGIIGTKAKALLIATITLPQLVAVGLPRFANHVRGLERRWRELEAQAAGKGHQTAAHPAVRRARREYEERLEQYIVLAVITADPLREKNWANARLGTEGEIRMAVDFAPDGVPLRIREVKTLFTGTGRDNPAAALKVPHKDDRMWTWAPAMIDFGLLLDYVMGSRRERLVARGLAPADYDLAADIATGRYALFVSPANTGRRNKVGGYSKSRVSDLFGRGLHFVCTEMLCRRDIPPYEECGKGPWRSLFAAHVARLLWGTYWCGVRGEDGPVRRNADGSTTRFTGRQIATDATTDLIETIISEYQEVSAVMRDRMREAARTWEDPRAFDQWLDRAYLLEPIDWAREPIPLPSHLRDARAPTHHPVRMRRRRAA